MKKINLLMRDWRKGTVQLSSTLEKNGYKRDLVRKYVKSGWLESLGYGAFKLAGDEIDWYGAVAALQNQKALAIRPGGKTALELKGYAHYLIQTVAKVQLFGELGKILPKWFVNQEWYSMISYTQTKLFGEDTLYYLSETKIENVTIKISSPEMAAMEMLHLVPKVQSFDEAAKIMEGLTTLRPKLVQELLEKCNSIKVKRLLLFMTEKNDHPWMGELDLTKINLGAGKRVIVQNGFLDKKYQITVPREYA